MTLKSKNVLRPSTSHVLQMQYTRFFNGFMYEKFDESLEIKDLRNSRPEGRIFPIAVRKQRSFRGVQFKGNTQCKICQQRVLGEASLDPGGVIKIFAGPLRQRELSESHSRVVARVPRELQLPSAGTRADAGAGHNSLLGSTWRISKTLLKLSASVAGYVRPAKQIENQYDRTQMFEDSASRATVIADGR